MTTAAPERGTACSQLVATLLAAIDERRRRLDALRAAGVQPAGLRELTGELGKLRAELATAVSVQPASRPSAVNSAEAVSIPAAKYGT